MYNKNMYFKMIFFIFASFFSLQAKGVSAADPTPQDIPLRQFTFDLPPRWNLVSLPIVPVDAGVSSLFPDAISAFSFSGSYFPVSELTPCKAYWVNLSEGGSYTIEGSANVTHCSETLNSGWHLFGAPAGITQITEIYQDPADILISVFGFENGYFLANTMEEGVGYWVNLGADGTISLNGNGGSQIPTNVAPVASDQSVTTDQNSPLEIFLDGYDPDGDLLTFALAQAPQNGIANLEGNTVFYTPSAGFSGFDNLSFTASDGELSSAPATISIFVNASDTPPVADPNPANPGCAEFRPICQTPPALPWPQEEMWTAAGNISEGAVRVLEGTYANFSAWNAANPSYDHTSCTGPSMRECCLILTAANDGTNTCPVPYNDKVLTITEGQRLTVRLPPSPCDPSDTVPLSGYSKVTAESLQAHQIGLCQEEDGTQYGCIHIDGRQAGPASLLVTAYYGTKQGACSAERSFGTSDFGDGSSSVLTSAFGTGLDERFNDGQVDLPPCCLNTIMLSVNVVEPEVGDAPPPLDKEAISSDKPRMVKGGVMLCNISVPVCQSIQEQLRTVIASHTADFINKSDVWLQCQSGEFQNANAGSGVVVGDCGETSFVNYEVYMSTQTFIGAFLSGTPALQNLIDRNDGSQNTTGFINGSQPYNYVFVEDLKRQIESDGLDASIHLGQAKASLTDYQVFKYASGIDFADKIWQPMDPGDWGGGVTSLKPFTPLAGRTTHLSALSQISNCSTSENPYCIGLARHNELRAEGGLRELQWDADLAASAKGYAEDLCQRNEFAHSASGWFQNDAENLYEAIPGAGEDEVAISDRGIILARAAESWSMERNYYNYSRVGSNCQTNYQYSAGDGADSYSRLYAMTGPSVWAGAISDLIPASKKQTGHFTLMMQASASKIGCGAVKCGELGPTDASMLSPQNRWVVACHYDKGNTVGEFPFSERTAAAFKRDLETSSPADDTSLCIEPCDGAMTTAERTSLEAIDALISLTTDPAPGYIGATMGACLIPALPQGDFLPALDISD